MEKMKPCKRLHVQAIGITDNFQFSYAENGNLNECTGEPGNCGCKHAEANLLKLMPQPSYVVLTHSPCFKCATLLHEAGVKTVMYKTQYRKTEGIIYLIRNGVQVIQLGDTN